MSDLLLGARLLFVGGRDGWTRTALTALGVGIGVALLLLAAAVPGALQARAARAEARTPAWSQQELSPAADTALVGAADTVFRGRPIKGWLVRAEGPAAPAPPGLTALPADGELVVSPALRELLDAPDGELLAARFGGARVVGTIGAAGLVGPGELAYYRGSAALVAQRAQRTTGFGDAGGPAGDEFGPMLVLLVVLIFVVLLLPIAVFLGAAVRFGGDGRDRRLAALRLVGADAAMVRRIAAGEAVLGALLGVLAGGLLFLLGRQVVPLVTVVEISVFAADIRPHPALLLAIAAVVPVLAVAVSLVALRGILVEPLGVTRRAIPARRRLGWRLGLPLVGVALLYPLLGQLVGGPSDARVYYQVALGAALLLVGVVTLLPWLIDAVVRRLGGGPVSWQLAVRRLQLDSATSARLVSGMAVAVAGTIGLQMLFVTVQEEYTTRAGSAVPRNEVQVDLGPTVDGWAALARLRAAPGVSGGAGTLTAWAVVGPPAAPPASATDQSGSGPDGAIVELRIGDCAALAQLAAIGECADGDVFQPVSEPGVVAGRNAPPGTNLSVDDGRFAWTVPRDVRPATARDGRGLTQTLLLTPGAIELGRLGPLRPGMLALLDPGTPDAVEHLRNAAASVDPMAWVLVRAGVQEARNFTNVRRGLYVGVVVTLLLMAASLLVAVLEQLRERRRLLAMLVAVGIRRRALTCSMLWQLLVPVAVGMALAVVVGIGLGLVLQRLVGAPLLVNWTVIGLSTGFAAAAVLLVNGLSLPALWRLMRADGLRTE